MRTAAKIVTKYSYEILSPVRIGRKLISKGTVLLTEAEARWEVAAGKLRKVVTTQATRKSSSKTEK